MGAPPQEWAGSFNVQASLLAEDRAARGTEQSPSEREARHRFLQYLPPGYAEQTAPQVAARDWAEIFRLLDQEAAGPPEPGHGPAGDGPAGDGPAGDGRPGAGDAHLALGPGRAGAPGDFRLRRTALGRAELSSLLRAIESFGLVAEEAVPWHFSLGPPYGEVFIDDVGLRIGTPVAPTGFELATGGARLIDALNAAIGARTELSVINRLVVGAGLSWREVNLLHAYCAYRLAVGGPCGAEAADLMAHALVAFPAVAAAAVGLFRALFGPGTPTRKRPGRTWRWRWPGSQTCATTKP